MIDFRVFDDSAKYRSAIPEVQKLFTGVFERPFPSATWEQWYFGNPYGSPLVVMAFVDEHAVGHHAFVPQQLVSEDGTILRYMLSISSMVDKQWRRWPVFNRIMTLLHESSDRRGPFPIVVLPNATSRELYRVLYNYRTLMETRLCSWIPDRHTDSTALVPEIAHLVPAEGLSYPTDGQYWDWRVKVNGARCWKLNESLNVVAKITRDRVLTVLDIIGRSRSDCGRPLGSVAHSLNADRVRLTLFHANVLGIDEAELLPHENYSVRLACRSISGNAPNIRFSLLLSDVF